MKYLAKIFATCLLVGISRLAVAMPMDYTFDVEFTISDLAGQTEQVFVTLDGVTGSGIEVFSPGSGMLALDFTFGGEPFSMAEGFCCAPPELTLKNGQLFKVHYQYIDFRNSEFIAALVSYDEKYGFNEIHLRFIRDKFGWGIVHPDTWRQAPISQIPSSGTLALVTLALVGLGSHLRKRVVQS